MRNFGRAIWDALRYWPSLVIATLCSLAVAALWSANIGACYPILELTLKNQTISHWMATQEQGAQERLNVIEKKLATLPAVAQADRVVLEQNAGTERATIAYVHKWKPWVDAHIPNNPFQTVALIVAVLMISTLVKHALLLANDMLVARVAMDISRRIRQRIFDRALGMDRAGFSNYGTSGISSHITHTAEMLSNALMNTLGSAIREPLKIASCLIGAGIICWRLLLLSMIVAPIVGALLWWITYQLKTIARGVLQRSNSFHEVMLESLNNIQTTQAYTMEEFEKGRFSTATRHLRRNGMQFVLYTNLAKPIIEFLGLGMLSVAILGGAYLVLNQKLDIWGIPITSTPLTVSALLIFFGMLIGASDPLRKLSASYSVIYAGTVAADALYPMLDAPSNIRDPEHPIDPPAPHREIQLRDLTFGYRADQKLLDRVSLTIPFGSTIAIVGHNGSGKSTLINLLCRFYDPVSGSLSLDGVDLRQMKLESLRKRIALVTQHSELYNETVAYNIRYGSPDASDEEVIAASKEAHADEFIREVLSHGYESMVGQNGQKLSGGQRQRIALARAILRNPEILILDESTSQIDMSSELLIRDSLEAHRGKRTMIIITHREALLKLADKIYEVEDGKLTLVTAPSHLRAAA